MRIEGSTGERICGCKRVRGRILFLHIIHDTELNSCRRGWFSQIVRSKKVNSVSKKVTVLT